MLLCNCVVGMSLLDNKRKLVSIHPLLPPVMPLAIDRELNNHENNQETLPFLINPANGTKSYDKGNIIPPMWQLKWSCAILLLLCKDVTSICACVRTHVFCVRQWSLGISTGSKTQQTLRTYKWAYKTCMLKMQTILSNTKQCYIRISLNIRKRVKDIISARTSSRFRVEVSGIWGLETWVYESWGFEVFDGSCPLWKCWMEFGLSREFGWQFNSFTIPAFLKNSFTETPNPNTSTKNEATNLLFSPHYSRPLHLPRHQPLPSVPVPVSWRSAHEFCRHLNQSILFCLSLIHNSQIEVQTGIHGLPAGLSGDSCSSSSLSIDP